MLGAKRQLSQGSMEADGPLIQRRRSSITQASTGRSEENDKGDINIDHQERQGTQATNRTTMYYNQSSSYAPIFNGIINGNVQNNLQISTLDGLQFLYHHAAMGAIHESDERFPPPLCYPGTRDVVVGRVIGWYLDKDGRKNIMWVHAPAGYGKTAVAGTVKEKLDAMELGFDSPVGATFFFWRSSPERNSPARFIITLAYQLAHSIPEIRPHVEAAIKFKPGIVKMALELQLVKLIVEPFKLSGNLATIPNRLVIIDGIDECINSDRESRVKRKYAEDQEVVQIRVLDLIHRLQSHHLPLSFLILSRPEAWIKQHLDSRPFCDVVEPLDLYIVGDHMHDVKRFVRAELSRIAASFGPEGDGVEWPEEEMLVRKSEGHMIYAFTVIRHIDDPYGNPRELLKSIVYNSSATSPAISHSKSFSSLYELYRQIMQSCPERNRSLMMEVLEDIMSDPDCGECAYDRALGVLDRVSRRPLGCGVKALRPLHAVLRVGRGNEDTKVHNLFIHSSFEEFLQNSHLSFEFAVDVSNGRERLLSNMLDYMTSITTDTISSELEDVVVFALNNWSSYWWQGTDTFLNSETTYIYMMKKIIALNLVACIIQTYHNFYYPAGESSSPLEPLFNHGSRLFHVKSRRLVGCANKLTSHMQSSVNEAFIFLLQSSDLTPDGVLYAAGDCVWYLHELTSQRNWREHKLIQALGNPSPNGINLFKRVIKHLYDESDEEDGLGRWAWDLLEHIYEIMAREQNPILESEGNLLNTLFGNDSTEIGSDSSIESDSDE